LCLHELQRRPTIHRDANNINVRSSRQQRRGTFADQWMIIHDAHTDGMRTRLRGHGWWSIPDISILTLT